MKKIKSAIITIILAISLCSGVFYVPAVFANNEIKDEWPRQPDVCAESAVLVEASTGTILYDKKCHKKMYPASITKIMTALLTIENCKMDETVVFSENAVNGISYGVDGDANFGCQIGEKMSVKDCLYVLMLQSANEVATALGEHMAGSTEKFAEMMNERAKKAGAMNTHFANANGLYDPKHYITAYDMAMITRDASKYSLFNDIVNATSYKVSKNNKRKTEDIAVQRHKMVIPTSPYYYADAIGGKTGFTNQSGTTLVTYAKRDGMTLIAVVLNTKGTAAYEDTKTLFEFGFDKFQLMNVSQNDKRFSEEVTDDLPSPFSNRSERIYIDKESSVVIPKNINFSKLISEVKFEMTDDSFANITYKLGDRRVGTAKLKFENTVIVENIEEVSGKGDAEKTEMAKPSGKMIVSTTDKRILKLKDSEKNTKSKTISIIFLTFIIGLVIIIIVKYRRKITRIRAMKRQRKR